MAPKPNARPGKGPRFYRRSTLPVSAQLGFRVVAALTLIGIALAGHWFDREGLRDNTDGRVSLIDVIYFTMITVTTVGYGDIVPVTDRARLFDTFVVTPIRLFVWLIFGMCERWRSRSVRRRSRRISLSRSRLIQIFWWQGRQPRRE